VPKITKIDALSLFQSMTSIFHDEEPPFTQYTAGLKARMMLQCSAKFTMVPSKNKKATRQTHRQTPKIRSVHYIQNSNFRFKSREKRTRGSERCEKDRTAINIVPVVVSSCSIKLLFSQDTHCSPFYGHFAFFVVSLSVLSPSTE
jgi:hypothetical protein